MSGRTVHSRTARALGRVHLTRPQSVLVALILALVVGHWSGTIGEAVFAGWIVYLFRQPLAEWTLALRFDPTRILTTPALLLGVVICLALVAVAVFPSLFAPYDPNYKTAFLQTIDGQVMAAPFPPTDRFLLGTDTDAHDLLSRILYGTGRTLTLAACVVALRLAIGCFTGWLAGWVGGEIGRNAAIAALASSTIPSLLFAWVFIVAIGPGTGFLVFVLALGLTGWAHWTTLLSTEIRRIKIQPYMEGAEAVGVPAEAQLSRYVLPNLLPIGIATAAQEVASALLLLAELGFLGVFYGHDVVISMSDLEHGVYSTQFGDWAGMLAGTRLEVFHYWWLPLAPAGAFFVAIMGFNLLADGLREVLDPTNRRPRPLWIRLVLALFERPSTRGTSSPEAS